MRSYSHVHELQYSHGVQGHRLINGIRVCLPTPSVFPLTTTMWIINYATSAFPFRVCPRTQVCAHRHASLQPGRDPLITGKCYATANRDLTNFLELLPCNDEPFFTARSCQVGTSARVTVILINCD